VGGSSFGRVVKIQETTCSRLRRDGATNLRQPDSPVFFLTIVDVHVMISRLQLTRLVSSSTASIVDVITTTTKG
jgi:hypothetical protein